LSPTGVIAALCVGHALDVHLDCAGAVHSVFSRAVNLEIESEMWTLLASDCADLPFGFRLPVPSFEGLGIRAGHCVHVRGGYLGVGRPGRRTIVDCRAAPRWAPLPPSTLASGFAVRHARLSQAATARAWFGSRTMARAATRSLQCGALPLEDVLAGIVGCGPGLTPAGDDVLVGILAVLSSPLAGDAGARAVQAMRRAIEGLAPRTTALSAHMLRQATRGLLGRMQHDLVDALARGTAEELECAIRSIEATGATSGADVCMGVVEAARMFPRSNVCEAA
jgi:hypothetical protein